jgi:hypothetical protein
LLQALEGFLLLNLLSQSPRHNERKFTPYHDNCQEESLWLAVPGRVPGACG